jgi:hypothetical protein
MDVICERCAKKTQDTLGNVLVAGWVQKNPEHTPGKRGWLCAECAAKRSPADEKSDKK